MMQINCPWCGLRNATEFKQYGERPPRPDVANATREQWADYLYFRDNAWGVVKEQWFHSAGCRQFFMLHSDTFANKAIRSEGDVR